MNIFYKTIEKISRFAELNEALENKEYPLSLSGISAIHKAMTALAMNYYGKKTVLVITEDEAAAKRFADDINSMCGEEIACLFPAKDMSFTDAESVSREYEHMRLGVLSRIQNRECKIVCASAESCMQVTIPPDILSEKSLLIENGESLDTGYLIGKLVSAGYSRADMITGQAQFSVRGDIIDIFPVSSKFPVRIELWGEDIDSLSYFDTETQRRTQSIDITEIPPASEVLFDSDEKFIEKIEELISSLRGKRSESAKENLYRDIDRLRGNLGVGSLDKYISIAYKKPAYIFDYLDGGKILVSEYRNITDRAKGVFAEYTEDCRLLTEEGVLCRGLENYMMSFPVFLGKIEEHPSVFADTFLRGTDIKFKRLMTINAFQTASWGGEIRQLDEDLKSFTDRKYSVIVMAGSDKTLPIIADDLREYGISCEIASDNSELAAGHVLLMTGSVSSGYDYPDEKTALITQTKALSAKRRLSSKRKKSEEIRSLADISDGDLVVHSLYGIGRFTGISKIETDGIVKDYITIKYAGTDVLYVPVTQLDLVSRYIGPRDDTGVKLNKLSSPEWQKTRARVKKAVRDMADELTALYAKRAQTKGYAFAPDDDMQQDFEGRFPYSETDDQLRCTEEIKQDMQKDIPMDRLLCGDVGFGKTEVAFRAAFKCMEEGKQCAILVPTTVLAWQHYQTALKRFEHFPFKIELLSRFRTKKQQSEIVKELALGKIDMIIGTHRLVQKDIKFSSLGLAIVDEEQRFGVKHKEKFKEMFTGVDMLTLSATPIPRTLNMAMSGIRDMSVIEEPPVDRYPVQTFVIEHNTGVIIQAINKELRRGGQVYYIHNRIETIEQCAGKLAGALPDARISVAHGQMEEEKLSEIWQQVVDHETDILVCTTIIETGVDVANVNTLVIEDADRMGLSQLYQLRGRVGRSNRRAFAYLTFRPGKVLTEISAKRLEAIREFTRFGSGFRVAVRDLEIRGAGSILGGRQHGHMEAVGYDMYLQLLSEALADVKGEKPPRSPEQCLVDLQIEAHIPDNYITSTAGRIEVYHKIAAIRTNDERMDLIDELIDRYGDPPKAINGLITVALVRNMAGEIGITQIMERKGCMIFEITSAELCQIQALVAVYKSRVTVNGAAEKPYISIKLSPNDNTVEMMKNAVEILYNSRPDPTEK